MTRGMSWFDTGTVESFDDATEFIRVLQTRQSTIIGCIEEVAFQRNFIDKYTLKTLSDKYGKSKYGSYLIEIANIHLNVFKKTSYYRIIWTFTQQFGNQIIGFVVSLVLARLFLPEEFGLIGMVAVFMAIGRVFDEFWSHSISN